MAGDALVRIIDVFAVPRFSQVTGHYAYALKDKKDSAFSGFICGIQATEPDGGRVFLTKDVF